MTLLDQITPVLLTLNEAPNIGRSLERITWANRVIVVDSGSSDGTLDIVKSFSNVDLIEHPFETHAKQWTFATERVETEWALTLDADYLVEDDLVDEMAELPNSATPNGYFADFVMVVLGKRLRRSLYPPREVLFRVREARFGQDGHTQRVAVNGESGHLRHRILHDDRKPLPHWVQSQVRYAMLEAEKLANAPWSELDWPDRIRRLKLVSPPLSFLHLLLVKGMFTEGWPGIYYAIERATWEAVLALVQLRRDHSAPVF